MNNNHKCKTLKYKRCINIKSLLLLVFHYAISLRTLLFEFDIYHFAEKIITRKVMLFTLDLRCSKRTNGRFSLGLDGLIKTLMAREQRLSSGGIQSPISGTDLDFPLYHICLLIFSLYML